MSDKQIAELEAFVQELVDYLEGNIPWEELTAVQQRSAVLLGRPTGRA